ncbi:MAG: hypothetical protein Q9M39_05360 [Sulfurovum sp.]|nr:hypothetical protein [Sulfurovum sp.]
MKFLVDAQLPKKISLFLNYKGHDSLDIEKLLAKNLEQIVLCLDDNRFVELTYESIVVHG